MSFEQRTPTKTGSKNIKYAIRHAKDKWADISVIYLKKGNRHTRKTIEEGIKEYEKSNRYKLKKIIVVSNTGKVHIHKHNS